MRRRLRTEKKQKLTEEEKKQSGHGRSTEAKEKKTCRDQRIEKRRLMGYSQAQIYNWDYD